MDRPPLTEAYSPWRAAMEPAFLANSARRVGMGELYALSLAQPEVIRTDEPMYRPGDVGLPEGARILVGNEGGRKGAAIGRAGVFVRGLQEEAGAALLGLLKEAVYGLSRRGTLWMEALVGLRPGFAIRARLMSPASDAKNMLDWALNFTPLGGPHEGHEGHEGGEGPGILILADPEWQDPAHPEGLIIVDERHDCMAILGIRSFMVRKEGTLTLAGTIGVRRGMVACRGGLKRIGGAAPVAVVGLPGTGKSAITNSPDHAGALDARTEPVTVIHDGAFLVDPVGDCSIGLERAVLERPSAPPVCGAEGPAQYVYTAQDVPVALDAEGLRRMAWGRTCGGTRIRGRLAQGQPEHAGRPGILLWLVHDTALPPVARVNRSAMAVALGATLCRMGGPQQQGGGGLQIVPFAEPSRAHSLLEDCERYRKLFKQGCQCYIMNTRAFGQGEEAEPVGEALTLAIVAALVRGSIEWREWRTFHGLMIPRNGSALFGPDYDRRYKPRRTREYMNLLRDRLQERITFLSNKRDIEHDMENLFIAPLVQARNTIDRILDPELYA